MASKIKDLQNLGLASMGAVLEYFDFQVYVFVAAALSIVLFPPGASVWANQVQAFGIYAIGYLIRPVAGMIIAHYADRIGRKKLFVFTVLLMSIPTFLMGLLPTYAIAGWMAPAALLLLRILQGCAVGGELPGASVFISEHAAPRRLGLSSGIFMAVVNCGLLLGASVAAGSRTIAELDPALASLAWRLPFILGGLFGLLAAYLRRHLQETPMFEKIKAEKQLSREVPLAVVLSQYRKQCLLAVGLVFVFSTTSSVYFQYMPTYLIGQMNFPAALVFKANVVGVVAFVLGMPVWGLLRDRFGWSRVLVLTGIVNAAVALWFFNALPTLGLDGSSLIYASVAVGVLSGGAHSMIPGLISSLFPTNIRQSGFAFPYSVGTAVFSGLTPLTLAWLVRDYGLTAPLSQCLLAAVVTLILSITVRSLPHHLGEAPEPGERGKTGLRPRPARAQGPRPIA